MFSDLRDQTLSKFEPKSYPYVFIGYNPIHKGFRPYHPPSRKVLVSRHVVFYEKTFSYNNPGSLFSPSQNKASITTYVEYSQWHHLSNTEIQSD